MLKNTGEVSLATSEEEGEGREGKRGGSSKRREGEESRGEGRAASGGDAHLCVAAGVCNVRVLHVAGVLLFLTFSSLLTDESAGADGGGHLNLAVLSADRDARSRRGGSGGGRALVVIPALPESESFISRCGDDRGSIG